MLPQQQAHLQPECLSHHWHLVIHILVVSCKYQHELTAPAKREAVTVGVCVGVVCRRRPGPTGAGGDGRLREDSSDRDVLRLPLPVIRRRPGATPAAVAGGPGVILVVWLPAVPTVAASDELSKRVAAHKPPTCAPESTRMARMAAISAEPL